ncbi:MAG: CHASE domain-containing protein, partial [Rhizobium sp.]|nr:CHASE domain-containing protein [Rhizobium sp.]
MASDRKAAQATGNAALGGDLRARLLAVLLVVAGVVEAAWLDAFLPRGWPAWLSMAPVGVVAAGLWLRVDRRRWSMLALGLALASLGLVMVAWPGGDLVARSVAPWLAALAAAVGLGAQAVGPRPAVALVARAAGGFLLALALLALLGLFQDGRGTGLPLGLAPILAWTGAAAWLLVRDLAPGSQRILRLCSALLAGLAVLVMSGWWLHVPYIVQGGTHYVPMQFNTAFCAFLMAVALRFLATGRRNLALLPLLPVVLLALVSLAEEYAGWSVGAGEWLLTHGIVAEGVVPGRMAPNTATAFLLGILGVVLAPPGGQRSLVRWSATWACGFVVTVIALIVLTGYVFGIPVLRGWGSHTPMALMTGVSMALIGLGLGFGGSEVQRTLRQRAAWMPVVVALGATAASVLMWYAIDRDQGRRAQAELQQQAELARQSIETSAQSRNDALRRMAERMAGASDEAQRQHLFRLDSAIYLRDFPSFASVLWVDGETRVKGTLQREGFAADVLGIRLDFEQVRTDAFERARRSGEPEQSRPIVLLNGRPGELVVAPIAGVEGAAGFVVAAVMHDDFYPRVLEPVAETNPLRVRHGGTLLYQRGAPGAAP